MSDRRPYVIIFILCMHSAYGVSALELELESRIVKGYKVDIHRFPHAAFLHFKKTIPTACGGSLITVNAIITAAHCLDELRYQNGAITAFLGSTVPIHSKAVRHISNYRIHPKFRPDKGRFNLGVAYFREHVPLGRNIQKIPIAFNWPKPGEILFTSGWGKQEPGKLPDYSDMRHLKASKQEVITEQECQKFTGFKMSVAFWCTISANGYHYHGDAGNGLVTEDLFLVGVVSHMINEVTIYSNVINQQEWMKSVVISLAQENC